MNKANNLCDTHLSSNLSSKNRYSYSLPNQDNHRLVQKKQPPMTYDYNDRRIIQATQAGLPLTPRPYHTIAEQLDLSPEEVMERMQHMLATGIIRRIGAIPNHYALGYRANAMTVWDIPDDRIDELGKQIGQLLCVSHCYRRPRHLPLWPYNLFAMVHGRNQEEAEEKIQQIATLLGEHQRGHQILYSTRILKKTGLRIGD